MNRRKLTGVAIFFAAAALIAGGCGKSDSHMGDDHNHKSGDHGGMHHAAAMTKIVKHDGVQFAFDLQDRAKHMSMMKMMKSKMKSKMKHKNSATHFISLTIINLKTKKLVRDAKVSFNITGPDGKSASGSGDLMEGHGMAHYIAGFKKTAPGKYVIAMSTNIGGKKHEHKVDFDLK